MNRGYRILPFASFLDLFNLPVSLRLLQLYCSSFTPSTLPPIKLYVYSTAFVPIYSGNSRKKAGGGATVGDIFKCGLYRQVRVTKGKARYGGGSCISSFAWSLFWKSQALWRWGSSVSSQFPTDWRAPVDDVGAGTVCVLQQFAALVFVIVVIVLVVVRCFHLIFFFSLSRDDGVKIKCQGRSSCQATLGEDAGGLRGCRIQSLLVWWIEPAGSPTPIPVSEIVWRFPFFFFRS